ncbi:hypothetical protein TNCV_3344321 [Trichonephila clavipes]|nr:hypothetical protein TNCV_3344321 [Trichonephila clavipes]
MDTLTTLGKLPTPATHHLLTRDVRPIDLAMNFNRRNALCIQELYHRPKLAGGGRRNESFYFGPMLPCYGHEHVRLMNPDHSLECILVISRIFPKQSSSPVGHVLSPVLYRAQALE